MAGFVTTVVKSLADYRAAAGDSAVDEVRQLAAPLAGARVLHINSTVYGGGVSEILSTLVPLMRDAGLVADWLVISGTPEFFAFTKSLHNALQGMGVSMDVGMGMRTSKGAGMSQHADDGAPAHAGAPAPLESGVATYLSVNEQQADEIARACRGREYDFVVVHDPQPAPLIQYLRGRFSTRARWIWRCHIDLSCPAPEAWDLIVPFLRQYDAFIFTSAAYVKDGIDRARVALIPPSIDPLSPKNVELGAAACKRVVAGYGIDPSRPLIVQVSRFDPWKDPLGVIDAYRIVKRESPAVQLALVGSMAADDPEGAEYYRWTAAHAAGDPDVHVLSNLNGVGNADVNAFQAASDVVVQKSTREGFGLTVTEGLWKARPVVAGNVGGIPMQVEDGRSGFLVDSVEQCAEKILVLLADADLRRNMGLAGKEHVRRNFLSTRHLADYLRLFARLRA